MELEDATAAVHVELGFCRVVWQPSICLPRSIQKVRPCGSEDCGYIALSLFPKIALADETMPTPWQLRKCQIYTDAWNDLPKLLDTSSFRQQFRTQNEKFMASACLDRISVCPQGDVEIEAANLLTIAVMNGGTASSFLPFRC